MLVRRPGLRRFGEQLLNMTAGLVDTSMVGRLGAAAVASVGLSNQAVMFVTTFFAAVATGVTALVARHTGAGEHAGVVRILHQGYLIGAAIGVIMTALSVAFAPAVMSVLRAPADVVAPGTTYLRGAGGTRATLSVTDAGLWLVCVPLAMLLTGSLGLPGAWIAMGVDLNVRGLGMFLRFRSGRWER